MGRVTSSGDLGLLMSIADDRIVLAEKLRLQAIRRRFHQ